MASAPSPFEVARETLRQLAQRRIAPTPDNYRSVYREIAGQEREDTEISPDSLRQLARQLPRDTPERMRLGRELDLSLERDAAHRQQALTALLGSYKADTPPAWNELIANLLLEWERRQMEWTTARKRQALERVLAGNDPVTLFARLQGLVRSWSNQGADPDSGEPVPIGLSPVQADEGLPRSLVDEDAPRPAEPVVQLLGSGESGEMMQQFKTLLLCALEEILPACLAAHPGLMDDTRSLQSDARQARNVKDLEQLGKRLHKFAVRLELAAGDVQEVRGGLLSLLRLLLENIDQLVLDDRWLHGQMETIREIVDKPANLKMIDEAERRLKDLIIRQGELKHSLIQAQEGLRAMLSDFLAQLATVGDNTSHYHAQLESCAQRLSTLHDITQFGPVLDEAMRATRDMQTRALQTRDELLAARNRAQDAENLLQHMRAELESASRNMRHDALTGILNRRGLDEAIAKEFARARRRHTSLCVALIDIDNFKKLNDHFGHATGDEALRMLAQVMQNSLRTQDTAGRYGGEEFVVLLPDTELDAASAVLVRLQRELTKTFFLAGNQKILVTFSAGVTPLGKEESAEAALQRADAAMYAAKQAGKNRVQAVPAAD